MRQAVLLEPSDLTALRSGTPLTIEVGGVQLLLMAPSAPRVRRDPTTTPNGAGRRTFTDSQRRRWLAGYQAAESKTAFLRKHRLYSGMVSAWKKRYKGEK